MTNRIHHVKMVTPEPAVVDAFLREVCDIPAGWPLGDADVLGPGVALGPGGEIDAEEIGSQMPKTMAGFIAGDSNSRQFQILRGDSSALWAVVIATRSVKDVYERARGRGVPCTALGLLEGWKDQDDIRYFFCRVAGITFEVLQVERGPADR